ncbi:M23 family metallopeptidase [Flavobacterium cerinum]|uniref:M23 family metallopeptidase n=1 Tax=Flavobacterium cerinum TaxID=2502784 RepID=A0ABY5ITH4_9FLAO|nr:M23 family metallopeptidase [Flavobacterium cerinum]UUC45590.1 M23 family metallopeptidase [Flavobacterium cerinum]
MDVQKKNNYIAPVLWGITITGLAILLTMTKKAFAAIVPNQKIRGCDAHGCGSFGASRGGRTHNGVDVVVTPGQNIVSPISGTITRFPYPYKGDFNYKGIEIKNSEYTVMIFYMNTTVLANTKVTAGQTIGKAQNIAAKYGNGMTPHVHIEVRDSKGNLINPTNMFV